MFCYWPKYSRNFSSILFYSLWRVDEIENSLVHNKVFAEHLLFVLTIACYYGIELIILFENFHSLQSRIMHFLKKWSTYSYKYLTCLRMHRKDIKPYGSTKLENKLHLFVFTPSYKYKTKQFVRQKTNLVILIWENNEPILSNAAEAITLKAFRFYTFLHVYSAYKISTNPIYKTVSEPW